jgi:hypothetical protein
MKDSGVVVGNGGGTQPIIVTNNNIIQKETSAIMSARKLPKKRKFDPSELEETDKPLMTENHVSSVVVMPPQSIAVDYSCLSTAKYQDMERRTSYDMPPVIKIEDRSEPKESEVPNVMMSGSERRMNGRTDIDLGEWTDHRVLAKREQYYYPGKIRQAGCNGEVWVEFDNYKGGEMAVFTDVLCLGKYNVISDASPSLQQIHVGVRVCVRAALDDTQQIVFVEGFVSKVLNTPSPPRFVVKLNHSGEETVAKRAELRLLQPPWRDELEESEERNGQPLTLQHVVPTLQPSPANYYRSVTNVMVGTIGLA